MNKILISLFIILSTQANSQTLAMAVEGVTLKTACNEKNIIVYGGTPPKPILSISKIEKQLNNFIDLDKMESKYKRKFHLQSIVNCEGENGEYDVLNDEANELELEIITFLKTINEWETATVNGKTVDYWYMWVFKIKKGYVYIENE